MKEKLLIVIISTVLFSCSKEDRKAGSNVGTCSRSAGFAPIEDKITVVQGVYGTVAFTECMPKWDSTNCRTCPVSRTLKVYEYTLRGNSIPDIERVGFFKSFNTKLIAETKSDANGFFQLTLQPGTYTMVIVEDGLFYASNVDSQGGINPFKVENGRKQVRFEIKYKATF